MPIKKRFSISPDLASGIRNSIQTASNNHGQLHYDMMSIDMIEPDPHNPRKLSVTRLDLLNGLNETDAHYDTKIKEFEALQELAESIKRVGIRNAIEVYKEGVKYRIISGERRYWAALLAGQSYIPARINQKPDDFNLRYMQWVENINRQDLSLWEKYNNLLSIEEAYRKTHTSALDVSTLKELLGISDIQSYRYFCLLKADPQIIHLLQQGKVSNLKVIQELVSIKNKTSREKVLEEINRAKEDITSLTKFKKLAAKKKSTDNTKVNLGKIDTNTARYLFNLLVTHSSVAQEKSGLHQLDWSSSKAISKAFKTLFDLLEHEIDMDEVTVNEK